MALEHFTTRNPSTRGFPFQNLTTKLFFHRMAQLLVKTAVNIAALQKYQHKKIKAFDLGDPVLYSSISCMLDQVVII